MTKPRVKVTDADYQAALHCWHLRPSWEELKARATYEAAVREDREVLDRMETVAGEMRDKTGIEHRKLSDEFSELMERSDVLDKIAFGDV